jgi:glycerate 2-kinase
MKTDTIYTPQQILRRMFDAAVASAAPSSCVPPFLPKAPKARTIVVGAGKAAAAMAQAVERNWQGEISGLVITRYGHAVPCERIEVVEAAHPVPDEAGVTATLRMLALLDRLTSDDLVLCLISGGGSALMPAPVPGVSLGDEQQLVRTLLKSGATIGEINCVRKHLSLVKGGRLARAAAPARVVTLAISDVPGDDVSVIASGPTIADPTSSAEALAILANYDVVVPSEVSHWLESPASETPKPGEIPQGECHVIATPQNALDAAAAVARAHGYMPLQIGSAIEGEARDVAFNHASIVRQLLCGEGAVAAPWAILSGGETTVTVRGAGRGGRNAEFLLALAIALDGVPGVFALAADTDGIDGTEDNAGAIICPDIISAGEALGLSADAALTDNDGYSFFDALGALVRTGPTLTNVNDFRAILIHPSPAGANI